MLFLGLLCGLVPGLLFAQELSYLTDEERLWLEQHPEIRLGVDPSWQPFEYFSKEGRYQGLASSYVNLFNRTLDINMQPKENLSWAQVIENARAGKIDVLPCVVDTPQRREYLLFTRPYLDFPMVIMSRRGSDVIDGIDDVLEQAIGVVDGYATFDLLSKNYPQLTFKKYKTLEQGLESLSTGEVSYFVDNLASISHTIEHTGLANLKVAARTPYSFKLGIGVRKDWPQLVSILDKTLQQVPAEVRDDILQQWITIEFEAPWNVRNILIGGLVVCALLVLVYVYFLYRGKLLEAELRERIKDNIIGNIAQALDASSGVDFFHTLVKELAESLSVDYAFIGLYDSQKDTINTIAVYAGGEPKDDFSYDLENTPCRATIDESMCSVAHGVGQLYPKDQMLLDMNVDGYAGIRLKDSKGNALGILVVLTHQAIVDLSLVERLLRIFAVRAAAEVERQEVAGNLRKLSLAVQYSPNAVVLTDDKGVIEYANPRFTEITGYPADEVVGTVHQTLRPDADAKKQIDIMYHLHAGKQWQGEFYNQRKDGSAYWATEHFAPILDEHDVVTHFVAMQQDITEAYEATRKISYQATHDGLTGLINRDEFENRLKKAVTSAREEGQQHALCFLDLDQFKVVNDTSGHVAGDELLRQIAALLGGHLRESDTLARLGGDEFAILIENCSVELAMHKSEEILGMVEDYRFPWEDKIFTIGVSIGITMIDQKTTSHVDVLRFADIACYAAKEAGRNRMHVYQSSDEGIAQRSGEMLWAPRITEGLEKKRFCLFVQEIKPTDLQRDFSHFEVLIRYRDEDGSLVPPGAFMPVAERYNLVQRVDSWVVGQVFDWLKRNEGKCPAEMRLSVNLSGQSLGDESFVNYVTGLLNEGIVSPERLQFEVTETTAIANLQHANHFIKTVREYGCGFSLDDFGSGLSSFGYLKNLDVDTLKIDGMFVRDILEDPIDAAMVDAINNIGHVMGMSTVAEFVENEQIAVKLFEMGVDFVQGYGIGRPIPIDDIRLY